MSIRKMDRREFVKKSAFAFCGVAVVAVTSPLLQNVNAVEKKSSLPPGATAVPETDPVAQALGYKTDVSRIDFTRYPRRKLPEAKNQRCKNCALYTAVNKSWGKCQLLAAGLVSSEGWCGSWSKKS